MATDTKTECQHAWEREVKLVDGALVAGKKRQCVKCDIVVEDD